MTTELLTQTLELAFQALCPECVLSYEYETDWAYYFRAHLNGWQYEVLLSKSALTGTPDAIEWQMMNLAAYCLKEKSEAARKYLFMKTCRDMVQAGMN